MVGDFPQGQKNFFIGFKQRIEVPHNGLGLFAEITNDTCQRPMLTIFSVNGNQYAKDVCIRFDLVQYLPFYQFHVQSAFFYLLQSISI